MPPQDQNQPLNDEQPQPAHDPFSANPELSPDEIMMRQHGQLRPFSQPGPTPPPAQPQVFPQQQVQPQQFIRPSAASTQYPANPPSIPGNPQIGPVQTQPQQNYTGGYTQPTMPAPLGDYQNTYQQPYQPPKSGKKIFAVVSTVLLLILMTGGAIFALMSTRATPDSVFAAAVETSLSTSQVKQTMTTESGDMTILYDVSKAKDPRVSSETKADVFGIKVQMKQYSTLKDSFVSYGEFGKLFTPGSPAAPFKDKWMQPRADGKTVGEDAGGLNSLLLDSYYTLFGDWIFGNFSAADKAELKKIILEEKVYTYDASKVQKKKIGDQEVYAYDIKENADTLLKLNKKVAAIWGVDAEDIADHISTVPKEGKITMSINIKTKQFVQLEAESDGIKVLSRYTDYNNLKLPEQPKVQADYIQFNKAIDASPSFL